MSATGFIAAAGAAVAALYFYSKSHDNKSKVTRKGDAGGKDEKGFPIVPSLTPDATMKLDVTALMVMGPALWDTTEMKNAGAQPNELLYVGVFADEVWLYTSEIKKDITGLAQWLGEMGFSGAEKILQDRLNGKVIGRATVNFDSNLPPNVRAWYFYLVSAQRWDLLESSLKAGEDKYPKFVASIRSIASGKGIKGISDDEQPEFKPDPHAGEDKKKGDSAKVDLTRPETWGLPDTVGPKNIETPNGTLFVPKGGRIIDGAPEYTVSEGDWGGEPIAKKWGKDKSWANAVAKENPNHTFGGAKNDVFPGTVLHMPYAFLDPKVGAYSGGGGSGNTGGGTGGGKPAKPSGDPGPGREWVWVGDPPTWTSLPKEGTDDEDDGNGTPQGPAIDQGAPDNQNPSGDDDKKDDNGGFDNPWVNALASDFAKVKERLSSCQDVANRVTAAPLAKVIAKTLPRLSCLTVAILSSVPIASLSLACWGI